jgi:pimeloyl-ACP methyl ester carboxylesterase
MVVGRPPVRCIARDHHGAGFCAGARSKHLRRTASAEVGVNFLFDVLLFAEKRRVSGTSTSWKGGRKRVESMAESEIITIVLVHGACAESLSNWKPVLELLLAKGYNVVAAPNPLRGVSSDAAYVSSILNTIAGPIILVGHSYGGAVITNAANGNQSVKALVYVAAFAPDTGESVAALLA